MHDATTKRIDRALIEETLSLHTLAYRLLMWIADHARAEPELLSVESERALLHPVACVRWLEARRDVLPCELMPKASQAGAFASLLSSFFYTSFHIERLEWNGRLVDATLVRGPGHEPSSVRKRRRHGGDPRTEALHRLSRDEGLRVPHPRFARLARNRRVEADLAVWTYALGMIERARGGAEGTTDWARWRRIADRKSLDAESVWAARARLLEALAHEVDAADAGDGR
jgi:hypothetical protein